MYSESLPLSSVPNVTYALELAKKPTTSKLLAETIAEYLPQAFSKYVSLHNNKSAALKILTVEVGKTLEQYMMGLSLELTKPLKNKSYDPRVTMKIVDRIKYYDLNGKELLTILHIDQFKHYLKSERNFTDGSIYNYQTYIKEVTRELGIQVCPENINKESVKNIIGQLKATGINYSNTNSALRAYAEYVSISNSNNLYPDEVKEGYTEGSVSKVLVNRYERDTEARKACIAHYGAVCKVCDMDFEKVYGELGKGFIHVHHIKPLHTIGKKYKVDYITDLVPLCPNCHAMIHKGKSDLTVNDLVNLLKNR
jgi:5-methylcytosine-specific restriction protein A